MGAFIFAESAKIDELARREDGLITLADKQQLAMRIRQGRGGPELKLTLVQLTPLRR